MVDDPSRRLERAVRPNFYTVIEIIQYHPIIDRVSYRTICREWREAVDASYFRATPRQLNEFLRVCVDRRIDPGPILRGIRKGFKLYEEFELDANSFCRSTSQRLLKLVWYENRRLRCLKLDLSRMRLEMEPLLETPSLEVFDITIRDMDIDFLAEVVGRAGMRNLKSFTLTVEMANRGRRYIQFNLRNLLRALPETLGSLRIDCFHVFEAVELFQCIARFQELENLWLDSRRERTPNYVSDRGWNCENLRAVIRGSWSRTLKSLHIGWLPDSWEWRVLYDLRELEELYICGIRSNLLHPIWRRNFESQMKRNNPRLADGCFYVEASPPVGNYEDEGYMEFLRRHRV
ncbi:uncharacterized protein LOC106653634 [Trichogramma pretiosum]|uniref:uncharacterized protein LOC106653634 n=1 Tax=Trichogramma pretiosum TaxID=7493 RepID=UPI0006C9743B|nr:uncharacterized protein LOC106653634 [Trichogramma pretiosum]